MKTRFTKAYMIENRGCYSIEKVEEIKCINNRIITLKQLLRDLPIKDFCWFLVRKCDLTLRQKRMFSIHVAEYVLPIFENKYPKDDRPRKAIEAVKLVVECDDSRNSAADAAAAYAAYAAAAYAAADAAYAAAADAYDAAYAAADDAYAAYRSHVWKFVESQMNNK